MLQERKEQLQYQINQVMDTDEFLAVLTQSQTAEDVSTSLGQLGISITPDEVNELTEEGNKAIDELKNSQNDELEIEQLEAVVGGSKFWRGFASVVGGVALGAGLGFISGLNPAFTPVAYKIAVGYGIAAGVWTNRG